MSTRGAGRANGIGTAVGRRFAEAGDTGVVLGIERSPEINSATQVPGAVAENTKRNRLVARALVGVPARLMSISEG